MFDKTRTYLKEGNLYYGLEITGHPKEIVFHFCEIKRKGTELFISNSMSHTTLSSIAKSIKKNAPFILTLNTSDVITKITDSKLSKSPEAIVHEQFPNLDFNAFYYELVQNNNLPLVAILKKEKLHAYLNQLSALKINVCKIAIGIAPITTIISYLTTDTLCISTNKLQFENGVLQKIHPFSEAQTIVPTTYEINGLTVSSASIIGFASVLNFISESESSTNFSDTQVVLATEFKNKRYFEVFLKISIAMLLVVLLINFLVFNYYFQEVTSLQNIASFNSTNKKILLELQDEVHTKEKRVEAILASSNSKSSFFLDQLAMGIPNSIQLSELVYQPLLKPIRESKPVEINEKTILISGISKNSSDFSQWIQTIETLHWVKQTQTLDYDFENTTSSNFSLKLTINEE
tara:strand:+ start:10035 stop:11249 length:1215 start_codon:yes stop_codon:yes gene_type:complete